MMFAGTSRQVTVLFPHITSASWVLLLYVTLSEIAVMRWDCLKQDCMSAKEENDWIRIENELY